MAKEQFIKEIERPYRVLGVFDGKETFHSGHTTEEEAKSRASNDNIKAEQLGIKTRYIVKKKG